MSDEFRASELPVASEVFMSMDTTPTPEAVAIVPEVPASERRKPPPAIVLEDTDERVEGLLKELLTQLKERKALEEVAAARWQRCSELLEEIRMVRYRLRDLLGPSDCAQALAVRIENGHSTDYDRLNLQVQKLVEWLAKPL